ncbi:MAG: hypothetical protein GEV08_25015 [Acidimicrobiia bacterium]|nr:hypothetical protein [Acidimicrobiia bacterium]
MTIDQSTEQRPIAELGDLLYRFEGRLGEMYPIGLFPEGIRFHNDFEGRVVAGPFAGGRLFGLDQFLVRPDGVGEIHAPEVIDDGRHRVALDVRGYVLPPEGAPVPAIEAMLDPRFTFPDVPFRVTGSVLLSTAAPAFAHLNRVVAVIEGHVNLADGHLLVEARAVQRAS